MALDLLARAALGAQVFHGVQDRVQDAVGRLDQPGVADETEHGVVAGVQSWPVGGRQAPRPAPDEDLPVRAGDHGVSDVDPAVAVDVEVLDRLHHGDAPGVVGDDSGIDPAARVMDLHAAGGGQRRI
ncbi:hypothetical protein [Microbispora sp. H11081]|uniref:hypothetical protein n=1 Tax=Microbispora sp. H11081 TaxID=2729107 RepID=UPI002015F965|nr:hypothetical protein [Microbispora sp. H11081]